MPPTDSYLTLTFASQPEWESWLEENHASSQGVWVKIAKKDSGVPSVSYAEVLDTALCFGWIDGLRRPLDETCFLQKVTPRRPKSIWSKVNVNKVNELIAAGRMRPAGIREVEAAQADGRWAAARSMQDEVIVPEDFQAALEASPAALAFFQGLNLRNQHIFVNQVTEAKRPETRSARIEKFVGMLTRGEKFV